MGFVTNGFGLMVFADEFCLMIFDCWFWTDGFELMILYSLCLWTDSFGQILTELIIFNQWILTDILG